VIQLLPAAATCELPDLAGAVLAQVNAARSAGRRCGGEQLPPAAPLAWNELLFSASAGHTADMARRNYFAHTTPEGVDPVQRAAAAGYGWSAAGENIAAGDGSVNGVMATWLQSAAHCSNIMNPVFTEVAVACVKGPGSTYGTYWTMLLGRR